MLTPFMGFSWQNESDGETVTRHISDQYDKESHWLIGKNYRKVWKADTEFPVFDIDKEHGGLVIIQRGGGQQTKSLRLEAKNGKQYVLRSIEKYAQKAVPELLRATVAADLVQDQISASHPYGAFVIPFLAEAAGVYHTNPKAVFIPDDPRFGEYQKEFANSICLYEERPAGDQSDASFFGNSEKLVSTPNMLKKLYEDNDNFVDQNWVLKSRLFDMFIADWDRHDDQWRWARFDAGKGKMYRPVPRDRDQAFFINDGLLMGLVSRKWGMPKFQGFDYDFRYVPGFNFNGRYFDRDFLNEPSLADWVAAADALQKKLTDGVIESAIMQWPEAIYKITGEEVIAKLKSQRNNLKKYATEHYLFLSKAVNIEGSNKKEYFKVERLDDENTRVRMYKRANDDNKDKKLYDRTFKRSETDEIRLYGLGGEDKFKIEGEVNKGLKIRIIGGEENDKIEDLSKTKNGNKTLVYDTSEGNELILDSSSKNKTKADTTVNNYNRKEFKYDNLTPLVILGLNPDDGVFVGGGFIYTTQGFRKEPFKARHFFLGKVAFATGAFDAKYKGTFTQTVGKWDLELGLVAKAPDNVINFFGFGNETEYNENAADMFSVDKDIDYYRTRFNEYYADVLLARPIGEHSRFGFGTEFQTFRVEDDEYDGEDRFVLDFAQGNPMFFETRSYQGLVLNYQFDNSNSQALPTKGVRIDADLRGYVPLNDLADQYTKFSTSLSFYQTIIPRTLVFAGRIGAGHNFGDFEYYQAQILSGTKELRGYRKGRFTGESRAYNNLELRARLFNFKNRIAPSSVGITLFNDLGRVWVDDDPSTIDGESDKWHHGYGGGVWIAPLDVLSLNVDIGMSDEGTITAFRMGFLF